MDIMMPVMDGYDTIRAIRGDRADSGASRSSPSPARSTAGERERCLDAGANDYVPKPVDRAELFAALRPWLPTARHAGPIAVPSRQRPTCPAATEPNVAIAGSRTARSRA